MTLVLQLVDRPRAYAEALRVLQPGGRLALATFDYAHFEGYFLSGYFPSFEAVDKERFPSATELADGARIRRLSRCAADAADATQDARPRDRARAASVASTSQRFQLISEEEYRAGLARAEHELPDEVESTLEWIVAVGER